MDGFFEIIGRDGEVIQRIVVLTTREVDALEANGYKVIRRKFSRKIWQWLLEPSEVGS